MSHAHAMLATYCDQRRLACSVGGESYQGKSQTPCSLGCIRGGNESKMASARCEKCGHPQGLKQSYTHFHTPVPSVSGGILCGAPACTRRAYVWLTDAEEGQYLRGHRRFSLPGHPGVQVV